MKTITNPAEMVFASGYKLQTETTVFVDGNNKPSQYTDPAKTKVNPDYAPTMAKHKCKLTLDFSNVNLKELLNKSISSNSIVVWAQAQIRKQAGSDERLEEMIERDFEFKVQDYVEKKSLKASNAAKAVKAIENITEREELLRLQKQLEEKLAKIS